MPAGEATPEKYSNIFAQRSRAFPVEEEEEEEEEENARIILYRQNQLSTGVHFGNKICSMAGGNIRRAVRSVFHIRCFDKAAAPLTICPKRPPIRSRGVFSPCILVAVHFQLIDW